MALLGNYSIINNSPGKFMAGTSVSSDRGAYNKSGANRNKFTIFPKYSAVPNGYAPGSSWVPPQVGGGLASYTNITAAIFSTEVALGINISANISGSGNITSADLTQINQMSANLSALGEISNADITYIATLSADLSSNITTTNADLTYLEQRNISASLSASMILTDAPLAQIISISSSMSALGLFTNVGVFATANISANISSQTELSPENLAYAVWSAPAVDNNDPGSMGEKVNDAGSAGNPWSANLVDNNTNGTFGWFVQKLLTTAKFLGFKFF